MRSGKSNHARRRRRLLTERLEDRRLLAGPYAPAADQPGSNAIGKDDSDVVAWATEVATYVPGSEVDAQFQTPAKALGPAEGSVDDVVTLGRGGEIVLAFDAPIWDGIGPDLAVFENSITDTFLELGFVEVSSDGVNFFQFESDSLTAAAVGAFDPLDPTEINNLAGKYRKGFGTPFDLEELADVSPLLNVNSVTHVRIIDVIGDGSQLDSSGDPIFDPFPTVDSAGLDLDAVGVIHRAETSRDVVDFEDVGATLSPQSPAFSGPVPNGDTITGPFGDNVVVGSFGSEELTFNNTHSTDFGSWNQWAYSIASNTTTAGFTNQFSSFAGGGAGGSATFGIAFPDQNDFFAPPTITRDPDDTRRFDSVQVTNTTYAALSMRDGDSFAKKFGGTTGDDPDFMRLTIDGRDANGGLIDSVEFYLADYRFDDNSLDYILDDWVTVDLSPVADARSLEFKLDSTDVGPFGINTPTYVAVDDIVLSTPALLIDMADHQVSESDGSSATEVRVGRPDADTGEAVTVTVAPVDSDIASLPTTVTIPRGSRYVEFPVAVVGNDLVDGQRQITVEVSADGYATASRELIILDDDVRQLTLEVDDSRLVEGSSLEVTVSRNVADLSVPLRVDLDASESSLVTVDESLIIDAGKSSAKFSVTAVEDNVDRPTMGFTLVATALSYQNADLEFDLIDNDAASLSIQLDRDNYSESESQPTAGLEDVGRRLASESFYNGADAAGEFHSEGLSFNNEFDDTYGSWLGWSYSNVTDISTTGFTNQYSAVTGGGSAGSATYAVATAFPGTVAPTITRDPSTSSGFQSLQVTNTTYAALSMRDGDDFAKKFGGDSGDDPDYFKLTIDGIDTAGQLSGSIEFYLSDFQFADNRSDYILDEWTTVDLSPLADAVQLSFSLQSSDVGSFGMNTPAYFAVDNIVLNGSLPNPELTVTRNVSDLDEALQIELQSSDSTEATVPAVAVIPVGESTVSVPFTILDDSLVDGNQPVSLSVHADAYGSSLADITVQDDDSFQLTLTLVEPTLGEADESSSGVVHRNVADLSLPLVVDLSPEFGGQFSLPVTITIPADKNATEFSFSTKDNSVVDGDRDVSIRVSADGFVSDSQSVTIVDDDVAPPMLGLEIDLLSLSESDASTTVLFEDIGARLAEESFYNGADLSGQFESGPLRFNNSYDPTYGSWGGWAVSNTTDNATPGFANQFSVITGSGALDSSSYAVASAFAGGTVPTISLIDPESGAGFASLLVSNTTYAAMSMADGDAFAKKFGGDSGDDADYFLLTIEGRNAVGQSVGTVDFYLADYRSADNDQDFIVNQWTQVDVSSLIGATSIEFSLSSSDVGDFGMNTPAYFAIDNLVLSGDEPTVATATVSRSDQDLSEPLVVDLSSADVTEAAVPSSVEIPIGAESISFDIFALDDALVDGDQSIEITASSKTHVSSAALLTIEDDDVAKLTVSLSQAVIDEADAISATQLIVHRNTQDNAVALMIDVVTTDDAVVVSETITIPQASATLVVDLGFTDNDTREGDREIDIQVTAASFEPDDVSLGVRDDETSALIVDESDDQTKVQELLGQDEIQVSLSAKPLSDVVVNVVSASNDIQVDSQSLSFAPEQWDVPQVIVVSGLADLDVEDSETATVTFQVDDDASDPLFADTNDQIVEVVVDDYQPTNLRISDDDTSIFLIDEATDFRFLSNDHREGIEVQSNESSQTISVDLLTQSRGLVQVDAGGGDDTVVLRGTRFTSLNGGHGYDTLALDFADSIELVDFLDHHVIGFEEIVIRGSFTGQVVVDAQRLDSILSENETLLIRIAGDRDFSVLGEIAQMEPIMIGDEFVQVLPVGDSYLQVVSPKPWQNALNHWDVDHNGSVSTVDALAILNHLAKITDTALPPITSIEDFAGLYFDVTGDGEITALDALRVINEVARQFLQGEAETVIAVVATADAEQGKRELEIAPSQFDRPTKAATFSQTHDEAIHQLFVIGEEDAGSDKEDEELGLAVDAILI